MEKIVCPSYERFLRERHLIFWPLQTVCTSRSSLTVLRWRASIENGGSYALPLGEGELSPSDALPIQSVSARGGSGGGSPSAKVSPSGRGGRVNQGGRGGGGYAVVTPLKAAKSRNG